MAGVISGIRIEGFAERQLCIQQVLATAHENTRNDTNRRQIADVELVMVPYINRTYYLR